MNIWSQNTIKNFHKYFSSLIPKPFKEKQSRNCSPCSFLLKYQNEFVAWLKKY